MVFSQGHALLVGADTYRYASQLELPFASQDAEAVANVLSDPKFCGYLADQVSVLKGAAANRTNILDSLGKLAQRTRSENTVFIFYCGHGDYDKEGEYHLICHDTQIEGEKVISGTGISQRELLEKAQAIPAQRQLWIFNTCHAGENTSSTGGKQPYGRKNLPSILTGALLSSGPGRAVLSACREGQISWTRPGELSIFTQAMVDRLLGKGISPRGGYIGLFELYSTLYESVRRKVEELGAQLQDPELSLLRGDGPFAVGLYQGTAETNLSLAEAMVEPPQSPGFHQVEPERGRQLYQQITTQQERVEIAGDLTGGDRTEAAGTQGFIQHAGGPVTQKFDSRVDTGGGAYIRGSVKAGGDFIGRDKITHAPSSSQTLTLDDFSVLLEQLRAELSKTNLEDKVSRMVESEITRVEEEAQDDKPSLPVIEARLTSIQSVLQQTAGVATAAMGLAQIIQQAIRVAQSLFI
jgi:hypothetical protein